MQTLCHQRYKSHTQIKSNHWNCILPLEPSLKSLKNHHLPHCVRPFRKGPALKKVLICIHNLCFYMVLETNSKKKQTYTETHRERKTKANVKECHKMWMNTHTHALTPALTPAQSHIYDSTSTYVGYLTLCWLKSFLCACIGQMSDWWVDTLRLCLCMIFLPYRWC